MWNNYHFLFTHLSESGFQWVPMGIFMRAQEKWNIEALVPVNHEHGHKFYLCQPLFKSVDIYVKMFSLKEPYMYIFIYVKKGNMY